MCIMSDTCTDIEQIKVSHLYIATYYTLSTNNIASPHTDVILIQEENIRINNIRIIHFRICYCICQFLKNMWRTNRKDNRYLMGITIYKIKVSQHLPIFVLSSDRFSVIKKTK